VADPGITWPASRPHVDGYNPGPNGAEADRIDFIYSGGPAEPVSSVIVGEEGAEGADINSSPWPTDHRATVSTFEVTPAEAPTIISPTPRLVDAGDDVTIRFHASGAAGEHMVISRLDGPSNEPVAEQPSGDDALPADGVVTFSTEGWEPGAYGAHLTETPAFVPSAFWVREPGQTPVIGTKRHSYAAGEPIEVHWNFAPGNRWDWIGVYKRGGNPHVNYYKMWEYTGSTVEGSFVFNDKKHGFPLDPGEYSVYLLQDDSYNKLAAGHFTVES
jgi:hypothetical protein